MNESEINKLINSMTKKFQMGGRAFGPKIPYGNYMIIGTKTEVLPKKSEVTQSQIDSVYNAEQDAFRKRAEQLIPELEQRNATTKQRLGNNQNWQTIKANSPVQMPVINSDPQYFNGPRNFKFENGGFIDCLRNGGSVEKCKCGCDKIAKAEDGKKVRRTDMPGYAYTLSDGTDVLTQDAVGIQSLPGSNYSIAGSSPEYETQRTTLTDKSGKPIAYNYNVYLNDDDHFFPIRKYTTQRLWYRPSTWLRTVLTPEAAAEKQAAYDANKLKCGGSLPKKKKNYLKKK